MYDQYQYHLQSEMYTLEICPIGQLLVLVSGRYLNIWRWRPHVIVRGIEGVYSILVKLHESAVARCADIGRIPGQATAQLDRFLKYINTLHNIFIG